MQEKYANLREAIVKSGLSNKIMIWGAYGGGDEIVSQILKWGFSICGYVDKNYCNIREYNGYKVYSTEQLAEEKYFVFVALYKNYKDVIESLKLWGYIEFVNYWYPRRLVCLDGTKNYEDKYGNQLMTNNETPINIRLRDGGKIQINSERINQSIKITSEGFGSSVIVGKKIILGDNIIISNSNGIIHIGDNCKFDSDIKFRVSSGGVINIGKGCSIQRQTTLVASFNAKIVLEQDCMISYFVFIRAGNSHNIIDLDSLVNLDDNKNRDVVIGKHTWVGMRATLLNGVMIGPGSVVGANAFVCKKTFPSNCCLGGNPAKVIREHIAWIRDGVRMHKDINDYQEFIYDVYE